MKPPEVRARLAQLAKWEAAERRVVSVYLNIRWADEQQRERVRIFLKNELRRAREAGRADVADLDWIEAQGRALIEQSQWPDAVGVALFVCQAAGLREMMPVRVPVEDVFVVNDVPYLPPLASVVDDTPAALVVFVDGTSARLIPLGMSGAGDEVTLESAVEGRHSTGGWAALAQSRYQRHIQKHREEHFAAVAAAMIEWGERAAAEWIVLSGDQRNTAAVRDHLPDRVARKIGGAVSGARYEPVAEIVRRAEELLAHVDQGREGVAIDSLLTEAAKGGQAVASLDRVLDVVNRGAVRHLYVLRDFREVGRSCAGCGALLRGIGGPCGYCRHETRPVPLDETIIDRVLATGGSVTMVDGHPGLERGGGLLAMLRYAAA